MLKIHKIWAARPNEENVKIADSKKYSLQTADYVLVFDPEEPSSDFVQIVDEEAARFSHTEQMWISLCLLDIAAQRTSERASEMADTIKEMTDMINSFEEALKEQEKFLEGK